MSLKKCAHKVKGENVLRAPLGSDYIRACEMWTTYIYIVVCFKFLHYINCQPVGPTGGRLCLSDRRTLLNTYFSSQTALHLFE